MVDNQQSQCEKSEDELRAYDNELNEQAKRRKELEEAKMALVMEAVVPASVPSLTQTWATSSLLMISRAASPPLASVTI